MLSKKNNWSSFYHLAAFFAGIVIVGNLLQQGGVAPWVARAKRECKPALGRSLLGQCYRNIIRQATIAGGVKFGVNVLSSLQRGGVIAGWFDEYLLVHEAGRTAAREQGINIEGFVSCPSDFNYGCQHGFFEYALSQTNSFKDTATLICEKIPPGSPKLYAYCYHGVGHGLMMALAYNLDRSLEVCNSLPTASAQQSCWQGVLMENSNVAITDESKVIGFSAQDPLSPCNRLEKRYQWQCYINHAGYLMKVTNLDFAKAAGVCLGAPDGGDQPCLQSLGLLTTNPLWQKSLFGQDTSLGPARNAQLAWQMCKMMPTEAVDDCISGAIANIHNFDQVKIVRSALFCAQVGEEYERLCFSEIGRNIALQSADIEILKRSCALLTDQLHCIAGAATVNPGAFSTLSLGAGEEQSLIKDDDFLKKKLAETGPSQVVQVLADVMPAQGASCHDRAHEVGRFAYEIFGTKAFKLCSSLCHSGCYHGATEAFFKENGTANLQQKLSLICSDEANRFFSHQCVHGVGHGLMAWSGYELFKALDACDGLEGPEAQSSCATGVFMENIVGGLSRASGHSTRYLSQDPQYPCTIVSEKYKGECYFLQTSRMIQLFAGDFKLIAKECAKAPAAYQRSCFSSMGRDASGNNRQDVDKAWGACQFAARGMPRLECISGAAQDTFWDPSGKDKALSFCLRLADAGEAKRCWETITQRASEVLSAVDYGEFCKQVPTNLRVSCPAQSLVAAASTGTVSSGTQQDTKKAPAATAVITVGESGFEPSEVTVKKGTRVVFQNKGQEFSWPASNIHPTHRIYPEFDVGRPLKKGESWEFTFQKAGTWYYHDHLYPDRTGVVVVVE